MALGLNWLPRARVATASSASLRIARDPSPTMLRTHEGVPRVDGSAAVVKRAVVARAFGGIGATLRVRRPAPERGGQSADHGDRRVRLGRPVRVQPAEPAFDGRGTATVVRVEIVPHDQSRGPVDVVGRLRVPDRGLRLSVRFAPVGRTSEQPRQEVRFDSPELRPQQLLEEMVVAIPLAGAVKRHHEQVGALERLQRRRRAARVEHGVAERARHALENRGPGQEAQLVGRQAREELRAEVVGQETVVPPERGHALDPGAARLGGQRRQVETGGPALRALGELGDLSIRQVQAGRHQQLARLGLVHAQLVRPDLQRKAPRPQGSQRQRGMPSRRESQLRAFGNMPRERGDGIQAGLALDQMQVIEDEHDWLAHRRQGRPEAGYNGSLDRSARRRQCREHRRVESRDPAESRRDVRQQDDRIIVVRIDRNPCERSS